MKFFYITCVVLCAFVSFAFSLECYRCKDCLPGELSFLQDVDKCADKIFGLDKAKCYKSVKEDGTINRGCTTGTNCGTQELLGKCSSKNKKGCYICCGKDKCNAGSVASSSIAVCLASLLLSFLFFTV